MSIFKKESRTIYFTAGISGSKIYKVDITKSFWFDTIFNFSYDGVPLKGYENYVVSECFRWGVYKEIEELKNSKDF